MLADDGYRRIVWPTFYVGEHDIVERQPFDPAGREGRGSGAQAEREGQVDGGLFGFGAAIEMVHRSQSVARRKKELAGRNRGRVEPELDGERQPLSLRAPRDGDLALGSVDLQVDDLPIRHIAAAARGPCGCNCDRPSCQCRLEGPATAIEGIEHSRMRPRDERNVHSRGLACILGRRHGLLRDHVASSTGLFSRHGGDDGSFLEIGLGVDCLESLCFTPFLLGQGIELGHCALAKAGALAGGVTRLFGILQRRLRFLLHDAQPYGLCRQGIEIGLHAGNLLR